MNITKGNVPLAFNLYFHFKSIQKLPCMQYAHITDKRSAEMGLESWVSNYSTMSTDKLSAPNDKVWGKSHSKISYHINNKTQTIQVI